METAIVGWVLIAIFIPPEWAAMSSQQKIEVLMPKMEEYFQRFYCAEAEIQMVETEPLIKIFARCHKCRL